MNYLSFHRNFYRLRCIVLLSICCWTTFAFAQQETPTPSQNLGVRAGWSNMLLHDQHTSPLLYESNAANIGLLYQREADLFFEVALTLSIGSNQSEAHGKRVATIYDPADIFGQIESYEIVANPSLSMLNAHLNTRLLWSLSSQHRLGFSFNVNQMVAGLGASEWHYTQLDIAPEYQLMRRGERMDVHAAFGLPIAALTVRPSWSHDASLPEVENYWWGFVKTNTQWTSVHQLFHPRSRVGVTYHLPNGDNMGLQYGAAWRSYSQPRPMRSLEQSVDLFYFF